jgi:hypothetical protein
MNPCAHDPCVFTGILIEGELPVYLGVYINDFTYVSASNAVRCVFEKSLSLNLKINWMGDVTWFLGKCYDWQTETDDNLAVSIMQTAKIEAVFNEFDMSHCNVVHNPYQSGLTIDSIAKLRHLNIREISTCDAHNAGYVDIKHFPGHSNVSDIIYQGTQIG